MKSSYLKDMTGGPADPLDIQVCGSAQDMGSELRFRPADPGDFDTATEKESWTSSPSRV